MYLTMRQKCWTCTKIALLGDVQCLELTTLLISKNSHKKNTKKSNKTAHFRPSKATPPTQQSAIRTKEKGSWKARDQSKQENKYTSSMDSTTGDSITIYCTDLISSNLADPGDLYISSNRLIEIKVLFGYFWLIVISWPNSSPWSDLCSTIPIKMRESSSIRNTITRATS